MALNILAVGDMHLGRRPSRLPRGLSDRGHALGPGGAWARVVTAAIEAGVDAVALAGDVVEREDDFFEGYSELERGVSRLTEVGIRVLGVVGNHDVKALPRLADQIPSFELMGRGGKWESVTIEAGGEALTLWGWSFPRKIVRSSPLEGIRFERGAGSNLGLLHCDRDQADSKYAPVSSAELDAAELDGWLLGHIHKPDPLAAPQPSGYLGSVTGMDPGEHGARGPWLVTVEHGRVAAVSQWVLAPLRWERLDLDLTGLETPEQAQDRLLEQLRRLDGQVTELEEPPEAVGLRVRLVGRTDLGVQAAGQFGEETREQVFDGARGTHYFIEKLITETRPDIPLEELARRDDPAGLLAQRLRLLDDAGDNEARRALIEAGRRRLQKRRAESRWQGLDQEQLEQLEEAEVVEYLRRAGTRMLEEMLAQREDLS